MQFFQGFKQVLLFLRFLVISKDPPKKPIGYEIHTGEGRHVSVCVLEQPDLKGNLIIRLQRKITSSDVSGGKCMPLTWEKVIPRGGKRSTSFIISLDNALELHYVLDAVLRDVKNQKVIDEGTKTIMTTVHALQAENL